MAPKPNAQRPSLHFVNFALPVAASLRDNPVVRPATSHSVSTPSLAAPSARGERVARMIMWAPLIAGAMAVVASQRSTLLRWAHDVIGDGSDLTINRASEFARTLLDRDRDAVVRLLGHPASSVGTDHWYFPVSGREQIALAVIFAGNRVHEAYVLHHLMPLPSPTMASRR